MRIVEGVVIGVTLGSLTDPFSPYPHQHNETNSCKLQLGDQTLFSQQLQAEQRRSLPRALRWNETFAFLAGGNVGASEPLELQLKQTVGEI